MINRKKKKYLALLLAVVTMICAVAPGNGLITHAADDQQTESNNEEIKVLDRKERTDLDSDEIATAEELVIAMDYGFDVENDFEGISYEQSKAIVSYDKDNSNFNGQKAGKYDTFYKQRFISQVMTSKAVSRTCEDIDEATLSYAEIKAVATGNPLIREKMEIDNDVQRLKMLKASYDSQHYSLQDQFMIKFPKLIAKAKEKLACVHADLEVRDQKRLPEGEFAISLGGVPYTERVEAGTALLSIISKCKTGEKTELGSYQGFTLFVEKNFMGLNYLVLQGKTEYRVEMSTSPVGNMVKIENCFENMQSNIEFLEKKLEEYERDMEQAKIEYEKPFLYEAELKEKIARQNELNLQLDLENKVIDVEAKEVGETDRRRDYYEKEEEMEEEEIVAEPVSAWSR